MKKFQVSLIAALVAFASLSAVAETFDLTVGDGVGLADADAGGFYVIDRSVDFDAQNVTTGDVVQVIDIPANTRVVSVQAETITAATQNTNTTQTFTIGDGTDPDGWVTSISVVTTAKASSAPSIAGTSALTLQKDNTGTTNNMHYVTNATAAVTLAVTPAYGLGKQYTAADTIDLVSAGDVVDGVLRVRVALIDLTR